MRECSTVCVNCKAVKEEPPCATCANKIPDINPRNQDVFDLWKICNTQLISSGFGIIGLNFDSCIRIAEILNIEVDENLLIKLKYLEQEILKEANKNE